MKTREEILNTKLALLTYQVELLSKQCEALSAENRIVNAQVQNLAQSVATLTQALDDSLKGRTTISPKQYAELMEMLRRLEHRSRESVQVYRGIVLDQKHTRTTLTEILKSLNK